MKKPKTEVPSKTRVRFLEMGRLYNLGNYENVSYKIGVEVAPGDSAKDALTLIATILKYANPKSPVPEYEYTNALEKLKDPQAWHKNIQDPKERATATKEMVHDSTKVVQRYEKWEKNKKKALELLDRFGGNSRHKDAKNDWDDWDDDEF